MKSPEEVDIFLANHWFKSMKDAHEVRNYLMGIYTSKKFKFRYPVASGEVIKKATLLTAEEAIDYIKS